jgi:glycosyltransferase involved in cell wall biosynthesis
MKITFASDLLVQPLSGVGRYGYELAAHLKADATLTELAFISYRGVETWDQVERRLSAATPSHTTSAWSWPQLRSRIVNTRLGSLGYAMAARTQYARILGVDRDAVLHFPTLQTLQQRSSKTPSIVVTVHDLSHCIEPSWHPDERSRRLDIALTTLGRADAVIAVSQFTADALAAQNWVTASAVHVVHNGVAALFFMRADLKSAASRRQVICVGTIEPRKNIATLLKAYSTLPMRIVREYPLLLVGGYGWNNAELLALIGRMQTDGRLRYEGYLPDAELAKQYAMSRLCVYPSLHEGFGLPVLEAFASGTPVIAGNHSSIPEVAGGHARLLKSVTDIDEMREAILSELESSWDADAAKARADHAAKFTWQKTAEKTIGVYAAALAKRQSR